MDQEYNWYVVYTKPRWEKKISSLLETRGIKHYCPLNKVQRQWSDRKKIVYEPLFKGYVFVHIEEKKKWDIKKVDGILNFVYWLGKPAIVKEKEIETIKQFLEEFTDIQVNKAEIFSNTPVIVKRGIMMNYKGIVLEVSGSKAKVQIDSMGLYLTAVFNKNNLEHLDFINNHV